MSTGEIIAALALTLTGLGMLCGGLLFLVKLGGYVARMQDSASTVQKALDRLDRIPAIEQHLSMQDDRLDRIENRTNSAHAHAMRAELISTHGE